MGIVRPRGVVGYNEAQHDSKGKTDHGRAHAARQPSRSRSYESDRNTELAPRQTREYLCAKGHRFEVPFAVDAEVPMTWECKFDGSVARLIDGSEPEQKKAKPPRTHWDMLLERRTVGELQELLDERLDLLRSGKLRRSA